MKIPDTKLLTVYNNMTARLNAEYPQRFWRWLGIFQKALDSEINEADAVVNKVWVKCTSDEATLLAFITGVKAYEQLVLRGFGLYAYNTAAKKLQ